MSVIRLNNIIALNNVIALNNIIPLTNVIRRNSHPLDEVPESEFTPLPRPAPATEEPSFPILTPQATPLWNVASVTTRTMLHTPTVTIRRARLRSNSTSIRNAHQQERPPPGSS